jgi:tRNA A37 threonylcarbamoyltransferase TsaD
MKNKKYVTVNSYKGMRLHDIAKKMTSEGIKMNHSTVRNILNKSFIKIAKNVSNHYDQKHTDEELKKIAISPNFQESIVELLQERMYQK